MILAGKLTLILTYAVNFLLQALTLAPSSKKKNPRWLRLIWRCGCVHALPEEAQWKL